MDNRVLVAVIIIGLVVAGAIGAWIYQRRRTERLRRQFGPEYDRMLGTHARRLDTEAELEARARRVARLQIRELDPRDRERFAGAWRSTQARFAEDPKAAVAEAEQLLAEVMQARGYPVGDFEQCADDISVHHAQFVQPYRRAHEIALASERGGASTEDLRQAIMCYRSLFEDLLGERFVHREVRDERAA